MVGRKGRAQVYPARTDFAFQREARSLGAGPQTALNAGLSVDTSLGQEPAWTLTAPVSLTTKMDIPALNISTSEFPIYEHSFLLAEG